MLLENHRYLGMTLVGEFAHRRVREDVEIAALNALHGKPTDLVRVETTRHRSDHPAGSSELLRAASERLVQVGRDHAGAEYGDTDVRRHFTTHDIHKASNACFEAV